MLLAACAAAGLETASCKKTSTVDLPEATSKPASFADRICHELHPCPAPTGPNDQPYMCAIPGARRQGRSEQVGNLDVEILWCPYRKIGEDEIVGVPRDGSRPLVRGTSLLQRVRENPRARALVAGSVLVGWGTAEEACPIEEHDGVLRFCMHHSTDGPFHCALDAFDSIVCARDEVPDRFLRACQTSLGRQRVVVIESTISPAALISPADEFRAAAPRWASRDYVALRAGGHDVRVLECSVLDGPRADLLVIDGEMPETVDVKQLLPRLDSVVLRAALAAQKIVRSQGNYLMLDPAGGPPVAGRAARTCTLAPGPREADGKLVFHTASSNGGPFHACTVDTTSWTGSCFDVRPGKLCD